MSTKKKLLEAAAGNVVGGPVYADDVFSTYLYEGTGSSQNIVNGVDLSGEGGLVWIKQRNSSSAAAGHAFIDTERGVGKALASDRTDSEYVTTTSGSDLTSFNSDGFSLGPDQYYYKNQSSGEYCSWTFRKQPGFFDVVTYTGTGSDQQISHDLNAEVGMMAIKRTNAGEGWEIYHREAGATKYFEWIGNGAAVTSSSRWNNTAPTSSTFTVGSHDSVNGDGDTYVAYLFAHNAEQFGIDEDESIIKCGQYSGNGSADGAEINLGWEPQWVFVKRKESSGLWLMADMMRGMIHSSTSSDPYLQVSTRDSEVSYAWIRATPTGFKLENNGESLNASGFDYIYMAIRRPHKPADAINLPASKLFDVNVGGTGTRVAFELDMTPDMGLERVPGGGDNTLIFQRLTGQWYLQTTSNAGETGGSSIAWDHMNGVIDYGSWAGSYLCWAWKRAPGYFDALTYVGTGSSGRSVSHSLGVVPEMMWIKVRSSSANDGSWFVYHKETGASKKLVLNSNDGQVDTSVFNFFTPTDSIFKVGNNGSNEGSKLYNAYLFATVAGVSKVGSYTGTGNVLNIDCGFTNSARFILIKRVDAGNSGNWIYWDFYRGINTGDDPWLRLDNTATAVTNTDYIDPLSSGFSIVTSFNQINTTGGEYIFYAIA